MSRKYSLLTVRMFEDDYSLFREICESENKQMSKVTRHLIMKYVNERKDKKDDI